MRRTITKLRAVAVVWSFSFVFDITHGSVYGSVLYPECPNTGGVYLLNTPRYGARVSQVHRLPISQLQRLQQNWQQAMIPQQQPQELDSMVQDSPVGSVDVAPRVYHGKVEGTERFKRQLPYQSPYGMYGSYNEYQDGNMWQPQADIYSQGMGLHSNAFQQTGFNQYGGGLYSGYQQLSPIYSGYGDSSEWMGYNAQSDVNSPSGFQNMNWSPFGSSLGLYNQGSYTGLSQSNYPVRSCYCGYTYRAGFVPSCQVSAANQQSQWLGLDQQMGHLTQYANVQLGSPWRSLEKTQTITQTPFPTVSSTTVASIARKLETSAATQQSLPVASPTQGTPDFHTNSQAALPVETAQIPTTTAASASVFQRPEPTKTTAPIEAPTSAHESPPPPAGEAPSMPVPSVPRLTDASTPKIIKAQRSILNE